MKNKITSLNDALAYLLQGMYFTEKRVKEELSSSCDDITSTTTRKEIEDYAESADDKMLKLERVFNYLMKEPMIRKSATIDHLLNETRQILSSTTSSQLRDILAIGCMQNINSYKISNYRSAYMFAVEMELDAATDLLQQILEWEIASSKIFSTLAIEAYKWRNVE